MKKTIITLIILTLIILISATTFVIKSKTEQTNTPQNIQTPIYTPGMNPNQEDCDELAKEFSQLITQANYCNIDNDCVFIKNIKCGIFINKDVDLTEIKEKETEEYNSCPYTLTCVPYPDQEDIKCKKNKCVVIQEKDPIHENGICGNGICEGEESMEICPECDPIEGSNSCPTICHVRCPEDCDSPTTDTPSDTPSFTCDTNSDCDTDYTCYSSQVCSPTPSGISCGSQQGDLKCHKNCQDNSDCPSEMPTCEETSLFSGDAGTIARFCIEDAAGGPFCGDSMCSDNEYGPQVIQDGITPNNSGKTYCPEDCPASI